MRKLSCLLIASYALVSLSSFGQKPFHFKINGEIDGLKNDSVILFINNFDNNGARAKADTIITTAAGNKFFMEGDAAGTRNAWIIFGGVRGRGFSFFIENGTITMKGSKDMPDNISATGTRGNNDQTLSRKVTNDIYNRIKVLRTQLKNTPENTDEYKLVMADIASKFDSIDNYELNFVRNNPGSPVSGTYLYVKQDKLPVDELEKLYNSLSKEVKNGSFASTVRDKIKARKVVAIGNMAPDFTSTDTSGNLVKFSDFRGKYVLLEFWANWCVPCRAQSPVLVEMYNKYKDKGFTIVQFSIDEKSAERKWKDAIIKDQLTWTQLADLSGFDNKVTKAYGVQPIPDNFLIDPQGKIIGRRLEGAELDKELSNRLK